MNNKLKALAPHYENMSQRGFCGDIRDPKKNLQVKKNFTCIAQPSGNWSAEWVGDVVFEDGVGGAVGVADVASGDVGVGDEEISVVSLSRLTASTSKLTNTSSDSDWPVPMSNLNWSENQLYFINSSIHAVGGRVQGILWQHIEIEAVKLGDYFYKF